MRIGLPEVIAIIIVVIAAALVARLVRLNRHNPGQHEGSSQDIPIQQDKGNRKSGRTYGKRIGIAFMVAGALFALGGMSMFRWAVQGYLWAFLLLALGLILLYFSRAR